MSNMQQNGEPMLYCMYKGPGPAIYKLKTMLGQHDHCKTKPQAPAYTVGIPYKFVPAEGPGPAYAYDAHLTTRGKQETPHFAMSGRARPNAIEILPGPGAYEPKLVPDGAPKISIGLPVPSPFKKDAPAPNAYKVKSGIGSKTVNEVTNPEPLVRSRTVVGSPYYPTIKAAVPGPNAYIIPENRVVFENRGGPFTVKSRIPYRENPIEAVPERVPGPGTYNPNDRVLSTRTMTAGRTGFSMGVKHSRFCMPVVTGADMYY